MINAEIRKNFQFMLEVDGIDQLLIQECTLPDLEFSETLHGGPVGTPDIKTPGKRKVGDFTVKKIMSVVTPDNWIWPWTDLIGSTPRAVSSKFAILKLMSPDGFRTLARYELIDLWPKKVEGLQFKREGDGENLMEVIIFSCTDIRKIREIGA